MGIDLYREHLKILIRLRDRKLATIAAASDQRKVQKEKKEAEALHSAIEVLENEIACLRAIESRLEDRRH